jgi:hypothetical protein
MSGDLFVSPTQTFGSMGRRTAASSRAGQGLALFMAV